jgi:hypothetical protein
VADGDEPPLGGPVVHDELTGVRDEPNPVRDEPNPVRDGSAAPISGSENLPAVAGDWSTLAHTNGRRISS